MLLRSLGKLSLTIAIIAAPQFYGKTADSIFCTPLARAADVDRLGDKGKDGPTGQRGQDGKNSDSLTVFADGKNVEEAVGMALTNARGFIVS